MEDTTFYRAKLRLEKVEPYTDDRGHAHARITEIAYIGLTGADADDAMYQMRNHVETLHDWHETQADQAGALDEAFDPAADKLLAEVGRALAKMPKVVVLCGSTRFLHAYREANLTETLAGNIVLSIGCDMRSDAELFADLNEEARAGVKAQLDELHLRKIDMADEVLVLNVGGYVGKSTRKEIDYAISLGKVVRWLEGTPDTPETLAERARPFVACKAPDRLGLNRFCRLHVGHTTPCRFVPADQLPASADDEGHDVHGTPVVDLAQLKEAIDRQSYEPQTRFMSPEEYERAQTDPRWTGKKTETSADDEGDAEPDTVTFHASEYADKLTFSATPSWLTAALESGTVAGVFQDEDYWYLRVKTVDGVVVAEPGDTLSRHHDGGLLVRSPDGLCKKVTVADDEGEVVAAKRAQGGIMHAPPGGIVITGQPDPVETYRVVSEQVAEAHRRHGHSAA